MQSGAKMVSLVSHPNHPSMVQNIKLQNSLFEDKKKNKTHRNVLIHKNEQKNKSAANVPRCPSMIENMKVKNILFQIPEKIETK